MIEKVINNYFRVYRRFKSLFYRLNYFFFTCVTLFNQELFPAEKQIRLLREFK